MPRLIDADALKKVVEDRYMSACVQTAPGTRQNGRNIHYGIAIGMNFVRNVIAEQPTIDAKPVRHGRWEYKEDWFDNGFTILTLHFYRCSECGFRTNRDNPGDDKKCLYHYCPNCGAKMDAKEEMR